MQNMTTMQSGEEARMPAAVSEAATVMMAPEPASMREVEAAEEATQPATVIDAAAEAEAPQQGAEVSLDGDRESLSPVPVSPSKVMERQISVDPASLRRLGMVADEDSPLSAPSVVTEVVLQSSPLLPPLRRPTFVGASLPRSAVSSPVHGAGPGSGENPATPSPRSALSTLARQHSAALARLVATPAPLALSRSASHAEGRTMAPHEDEEHVVDHTKALAAEDGFTCGALCMLIPGFYSKKKPATANAAGTDTSSNLPRQQSAGRAARRSSASRVASLERFECGSWSPPPPPVAQEVPIKTNRTDDDTESPVKTAFVFDGEAPTTRGILKNSASSRLSSARHSNASQRHVRFSTAAAVADAGEAASWPSSPPSVVTPRLARARAEFNAFLEAQSA